MNKALFISFASTDKERVQAVCDILEREAVPCWIASRDVTPGENWGRSIIEAIDDCPAMLLMLSKAANESVHVANEVERCVSKRKLLYIVRVEDVIPSPTLELHVSSRQWTDAWHRPIEPPVRVLAQNIREKLGIVPPQRRSDVVAKDPVPDKKSAADPMSKLAELAARIASHKQEAAPNTDVDSLIQQALSQIDAKESGSMGSFYVEASNLRSVYRLLTDKLKGVPGEAACQALLPHLEAEDPLTKWKAMNLLLLFGYRDASTARRYWETQTRWIPRQLLFDVLKILRAAERTNLLSEVAQFDENARIRERALQALVEFGAGDYPEALVPAVLQGLRDDNEGVRRAAVLASAEINTEIAAEIALERLKEDNSWAVRVAAAQVLEKCGGVDAVPTLADALERNRINEHVLSSAAKGIANRFGAAAVATKARGIAANNAREAVLKVIDSG